MMTGLCIYTSSVLRRPPCGPTLLFDPDAVSASLDRITLSYDAKLLPGFGRVLATQTDAIFASQGTVVDGALDA